MAKLLLVGAALLLCLSTVAAGEGCKDTITGFSGTFGKRIAGRLDRFTNQTGQWRSKGAISKVEGFYSTNYGCIQGVKVTYGPNPADARLLGQEVAGLTTRELALNEGEHINKVQIKADNCVEYLRLHTSEGRLFELGNAGSPTTLITSYPNRPTGFLAAVRGFEEYTKNGGSVSRASLRTLQFVWANCNSVAGQRSGTFGGSGSGGVSARHSSGLELESAPLDAAAAAEAGAMIPSGTKAPAEPADPAAAAVEALACPAQVDMCASDASSTSTAFCPVVAPFKKAACMGGCCVSSGKCTSSSCAISGIGKEVPNTICYGLNPAIAIGASASCRGLACKLSVPGCTSDLLGGSCVGTVVDLSGGAATKNPAGAKLLGYPCLDVTPSDKTLNKDGALVKDGEYVAKLWSICDCHAPTVITRQGFLGFPAIGKLNITDLKGLVAAFRPDNGSSPLHGVLEAVKAKLPPMVIPEGENALNLTTALSVIGNLVGKAAGSPDGEANQLGAVADLIKGAAAVAAAGNSSNPLGSLLGALAPKSGGNQTNPLAGLGNLVAALSPKGAGVTEKSDVLSTVLGALNSGTGAAPQADLLGAVSKLVAGANESGVDLSTLVSKFKPGNATEVMKSLLGAVSQGRDAANGQVDLAGILNKAKEYVAGSAGAHPGLEKIISGVQTLAENSGAADKGLGLLKNFAQDAAGRNGSATLQSIVDMASKAGPLLQQLQGGGAAVNEAGPAGVGPGGENAWAGMLKNMASEKGPLAGVDVDAVTGLAQKVAPLLQALGSGQGGPTGKEIMAAAEGVGQGINLDGNNWKSLQEAAQKLTPVLETLSKSAGAANNPNLAGLQGLIDRMRQPAETVAAAVPAAVPDLSGPAPGVIKAMSLPVDVAAPVAAASVPAAAAAAAVPATVAAAAVPAAAAAAVPAAAAAAVPAAAAAVPAAAAAVPAAAAAVPAAAAAAVPAAAAVAAVPAAAAAAVPAAAVPAAAAAAVPAAAAAGAAGAAATKP